MESTTSRRDLLKVAPAAAVVVAAPTFAAQPTFIADTGEWGAAKLAYAAATDRYMRAIDAEVRRDSEIIRFSGTAPTRKFTVHVPAESIELNGMVKGFYRLEAYDETVVLTLQNVKRQPAHVTATEEFRQYLADLDAWKAERERVSAQRGWAAIEREWRDACDAHDSAWRALVACPVTNLAQLAEKIEIVRRSEILSDDERTLCFSDAVAADAARLLGRA